MAIKYSTKSFYIGDIRAAVQRHGGRGNPVVVATHISSDDFTAQGHAETGSEGAAQSIERLAEQVKSERLKRAARRQALADQLDTGVITRDQYEAEVIFHLG